MFRIRRLPQRLEDLGNRVDREIAPDSMFANSFFPRLRPRCNELAGADLPIAPLPQGKSAPAAAAPNLSRILEFRVGEETLAFESLLNYWLTG